jgi:hypothetical protein
MVMGDGKREICDAVVVAVEIVAVVSGGVAVPVEIVGVVSGGGSRGCDGCQWRWQSR